MFRFGLSALAFAALIGVTPAFAQGSDSNGSSQSEMASCKAKVTSITTDVQGTKDPEKQSAAMKELDLAKAAMADGKSTECLVHLDKVNSAMK